MACPGSIALSRGLEDGGSSYAREGTAAHAVAEGILTGEWVPTANWKGLESLGTRLAVQSVAVEAGGRIPVTPDLLAAVEVYVRFCRQLADSRPDVRTEVEVEVNLDMLKPPAEMYGTGDYLAYVPGEWLHVVDYKHGAGVAVEVKGNTQLMYYALAAYCYLASRGMRFPLINATIVQPRAQHIDGPIRTVTYSVEELLDWGNELIAAAERALEPGAPLALGSHCRFCRALAKCPQAKATALELAQSEFPAATLSDATEESIASLLDTVDDWLENWCRAVRGEGLRRLENGADLPGWKLVPKRATRKWADEPRVLEWIKRRRLKRDVAFDVSLKSVAQMEKALGKGRLPADLVKSESSGNTLARLVDPRGAVDAGAGGEFFV
jgi:hypothetical protein